MEEFQPPPSTEKRYRIAVCIKRKGMASYRVDFDVVDEVGAMLLARLLQEHDEEVLLTEIAETRELRRVKIKQWRLEQKAD